MNFQPITSLHQSNTSDSPFIHTADIFVKSPIPHVQPSRRDRGFLCGVCPIQDDRHVMSLSVCIRLRYPNALSVWTMSEIYCNCIEVFKPCYEWGQNAWLSVGWLLGDWRVHALHKRPISCLHSTGQALLFSPKAGLVNRYQFSGFHPRWQAIDRLNASDPLFCFLYPHPPGWLSKQMPQWIG